MKSIITFFLSVIVTTSAVAQSQYSTHTNPYLGELSSQASQPLATIFLLPGFFSPDRQQQFRPKSPLLFALASSATLKSGNYWMGSMTTQSYNQGKLGTYYLWDVQGNLRESRMFLDIAGKNKRGLKLIFRRR